MIAKNIPRGLRNNNWGNIRKGINWKGLRSTQTDPAFAQFVSPEWGIRAMARIVAGDFRQGKSLAETIAEYAPKNENDTAAYIRYVSERAGVEPGTVLSDNDSDELAQVLAAMVEMENGIKINAQQWAVILHGIELERSA